MATTTLEPRRVKSRTILCTVLSILWLFPSAGALWILARNSPWSGAVGFRETLASVTLEQWIALGLLLLQGLFVALAVRFHFREEPKAFAPEQDTECQDLETMTRPRNDSRP